MRGRYFQKKYAGSFIGGIVVLFITLIVLSSFVSAHDKSEKISYEITPESILTEISTRGPQPIVKEMYENGSAWDIVLEGIASGDPEWIKVANALMPGSDAGSSSMLEVSMFFALETSPELVLDSLQLEYSRDNPSYLVKSVCSSNFLIDYPANEDSLNFINKRIHILEKVSDNRLLHKRDECIAGLEKALALT